MSLMELPGSRRGIFLLAGGVICLLAAGLLVAAFSGKWDKNPSGQIAGPAPFVLTVEDTGPGDSSVHSQPTGSGTESQWVIYITGAVMRPGVYRMPPGTRVYQAVEQAGGFTSEADPEAFNMALPLDDGIHIHVPRKSEGHGPPVSGQVGAVGGGTALIDLNRSDAAALQSLPGIGPKLAQEIIRHREERGRFTSVEDLLSVKGIGEKKFSDIRNLVTVSR